MSGKQSSNAQPMSEASPFRPTLLWLLILAPIVVLLEHRGDVPAGVIFFCAALAIMPFAKLIVQGTEQIAAHSGATIGGLLNASFGNLPELIITLAALRAGLLEMVRASIVGALLANLLVALGMSFLLGGLRRHTQEYNPNAVRAFSSIMVLAWISLALPSAFHRALGSETVQVEHGTLDFVVAIVLLAVYGLFLLYFLKTHPETFSELEASAHHEGTGKHSGLAGGLTKLLAASVGAAWMSEILVGAAEEAGHSLGMSQMFMGVIVLALVGGAAEYGSAIAMGRANRVDLSIGIAMGSCVQIALFVAPILVLLAPVMGQPDFQLAFTQAEMWMLFGAVLLGATVATGQSTWFKGAQLLALYVIIAAVLYLVPAASEGGP
jgi:Ca2+:H+ antiporter